MPEYKIGFIGFGEAASAFVSGWRTEGLSTPITAYDIQIHDESQRPQLVSRCANLDVTPVQTSQALRNSCNYIVSSVIPEQTLAAASSIGNLDPTHRYLDINSTAPDKKRQAARIVGTGYLDLAVLSPVHPKGHKSPILVAGTTADEEDAFFAHFFPNAEIFSKEVGSASLVKMIRSIFVKGFEAVAMECALAIHKVGLAEQIYPSLDIVLRHNEAQALSDYTMERMAVHGLRRASEMESVCETLAELGLPSYMSQASGMTQKLVGDLNLSAQYPGGTPTDAEHLAGEILKRLGVAPANPL